MQTIEFVKTRCKGTPNSVVAFARGSAALSEPQLPSFRLENNEQVAEEKSGREGHL